MLEYTRLPMPLGGVVRRLGYQDGQPHTSPAALNVRPDDLMSMRERIGSRPGLHTLYATQLPGPIRLVTDVEWVSAGGLQCLALLASGGVLYRDNALHGYGSPLTKVATQSVTLRSDQLLTAASLLQKVYIAGDNTANHKIACYDPATDTLAGVTESAGTQPTKCSIVVNWRERLVLAEDSDNPHRWYMPASGDPTNWDYSATGAGAAVAATNMVNGELGQPIRAVIPNERRCILFGCTSSIHLLLGDPLMGGQMTQVSSRIGIVGRRAWCRDPEGNTWFLSWDGVYMFPRGCPQTEPVCVSRNRLPLELTNTDWSRYDVSMAYDVQHRGIHLFVTTAPPPPGVILSPESNRDVWGNRPDPVISAESDRRLIGGSPASVSSWTSVGTSSHWWISRESPSTKDIAFWPVSFQLAHDPLSAWELRALTAASPTDSLVLLGCRDGNVRIHDRQYAQDDGADIPSYIDLGPYEIGKPGHDGKLLDLVPTTSAGSGKVSVAIRVGNSAEAAFNAASAFVSYDYPIAGPQHTVKPRARGNAAVLRVSGSDASPTTPWSLEEILIRHQPAGLRRLA